VILYPSYISR